MLEAIKTGLKVNSFFIHSLCDFQVVTYLNLCFSFYEMQRVKSIYARVFQPVNTSISIPRFIGLCQYCVVCKSKL